MNGLVLSIWLVLGGIALAVLGLWTNSEALMAAGSGALALVCVSWPVILLIGITGRDNAS